MRARVDTPSEGKHGQDKRNNNTWQKPPVRDVRIHHSKRIQHTPTHYSFLPVLFPPLSCLIPMMAIEHFRIVFVFLFQDARRLILHAALLEVAKALEKMPTHDLFRVPH